MQCKPNPRKCFYNLKIIISFSDNFPFAKPFSPPGAVFKGCVPRLACVYCLCIPRRSREYCDRLIYALIFRVPLFFLPVPGSKPSELSQTVEQSRSSWAPLLCRRPWFLHLCRFFARSPRSRCRLLRPEHFLSLEVLSSPHPVASLQRCRSSLRKNKRICIDSVQCRTVTNHNRQSTQWTKHN